ncbi:MAG: hypothetical protein NTY59_01040 [Alphaproteobacteria bacterium]|nr:hypothetical protein [Alphaproteobacteria bacterium]
MKKAFRLSLVAGAALAAAVAVGVSAQQNNRRIRTAEQHELLRHQHQSRQGR